MQGRTTRTSVLLVILLGIVVMWGLWRAFAPTHTQAHSLRGYCDIAGYTPQSVVYIYQGETSSQIRAVDRRGTVNSRTILETPAFDGWPVVNSESEYLLDITKNPKTYHDGFILYSFEGEKIWEMELPNMLYSIDRFDHRELIWVMDDLEAEKTIWKRLDLATLTVTDVAPHSRGAQEERPSKRDIPTDVVEREQAIPECTHWPETVIGS